MGGARSSPTLGAAPPLRRGRLGGGERSHDASDFNALRESSPDLSPSSPPMRLCAHQLHRSEIMTSGWCGGDRVGWQSCCFRPKLRPAGLSPTAKPLFLRRAGPCDGPAADQGSRAHGSRDRLSGNVEASASGSGPAGCTQVRRCGIGRSRSPLEPSHKLPAGRRGVSLISFADYRIGANASPVPLRLPRQGEGSLKPPKPMGCRACSLALGKAPHHPHPRCHPGEGRGPS